MKNKLLLWLTMMLVCLTSMAKSQVVLLPMPQQMVVTGGSFTIGKVMLETPVLQSEWEEFITDAGGMIVPKSSRKIVVKLVPEVDGAKMNQEEAYRLVVSGKEIKVEATTQKGVYWALQTLRQLERSKGRFEACEILDWPAFKIRGFMQDVVADVVAIYRWMN